MSPKFLCILFLKTINSLDPNDGSVYKIFFLKLYFFILGFSLLTPSDGQILDLTTPKIVPTDSPSPSLSIHLSTTSLCRGGFERIF